MDHLAVMVTGDYSIPAAVRFVLEAGIQLKNISSFLNQRIQVVQTTIYICHSCVPLAPEHPTVRKSDVIQVVGQVFN